MACSHQKCPFKIQRFGDLCLIDRCSLGVQDIGDGLDHVYFAPVTSEGLEKRLGIKLKPHPDKVSEAAALSSVQAPTLQYSLCLPKGILLSEFHPYPVLKRTSS